MKVSVEITVDFACFELYKWTYTVCIILSIISLMIKNYQCLSYRSFFCYIEFITLIFLSFVEGQLDFFLVWAITNNTVRDVFVYKSWETWAGVPRDYVQEWHCWIRRITHFNISDNARVVSQSE